MKITNSIFYLIVITALAAFIIIGLSYFSRHHSCCGGCRMHAPAEHTFAMIKPDAVAAGNANSIITEIKNNGFNIIAQRETTLDKETAEKFYAAHKNKPFFHEAINFITSGPVIVLALEKENAIKDWRALMGTTNPAQAAEGTIRKKYGTDITHNAVHGSDSVESAHKELHLFFPEL